MMDNQQLPWIEAFVSKLNIQRFVYVSVLVEYAWYLLSQHPHKDHRVYKPSWTIGAEGN
jgi:hypothetical protein